MHLTFVYLILAIGVEIQCNELTLGTECFSISANSSGYCELLTKCKPVLDEVVLTQRLPQTCGFKRTQPIVCCPGKKDTTPGAISRAKCREYSSYAYHNTSETECGHRIVKRIIGGDKASIKEFAHMAVIGYEVGPGAHIWFCAGSVISEWYILTSGYCASSPNDWGKAKYVDVGRVNLWQVCNPTCYTAVEHIPHPEYRIDSLYNDIGLLKVDKQIKFSKLVRPACLYTEHDVTVSQVIASGWGNTKRTGQRSNTLLKTTLNLIDHKTCDDAFEGQSNGLESGILNDIQFCAAFEEGKRKTLAGDTGGPIQIYHEGDNITCMYDILGVIANEEFRQTAPNVYTRVSHFIPWIEDIVWKDTT